MRNLSNVFNSIQTWLFPVLEEEIGELTKKQYEFVRIVELIDPARFMGQFNWCGLGRIKEPRRLELQLNRSLDENLADLPAGCDWGYKKNSKGKKMSWRGYKLHLDCMDAAYDAPEIREFSKSLGHVPIIDYNKRKGEKRELSPAEKIRYNERSTAERVNADLKDNCGGRSIRVKGHEKVLTHLMFGVIAITAKQLFNMLFSV